MNKIHYLLIAVLVGLVVYLGIGYYISFQLTHVDRKVIETTPGSLGLDLEEVVFNSTDGLELRGWKTIPELDRGITIIFVHGIGENRAQHHHIELAKHFSGQGIGSLLFDLRGAGESEGSLVSGGFFERFDVLAAVNEVDDDSCRVVFGSSLGGAASFLAAEELGGEISGLVVDSAYADINDLLASEIHNSLSIPLSVARVFIPGASLMARVIYDIDLSRMIPETIAPTLPYPLQIIHGQQDSRIPVSHAERLFEAAPEGSNLLIVEGAEHTTAYVTDPDSYADAVNRYINTVCLHSS